MNGRNEPGDLLQKEQRGVLRGHVGGVLEKEIVAGVEEVSGIDEAVRDHFHGER